MQKEHHQKPKQQHNKQSQGHYRTQQQTHLKSILNLLLLLQPTHSSPPLFLNPKQSSSPFSRRCIRRRHNFYHPNDYYFNRSPGLLSRYNRRISAFTDITSAMSPSSSDEQLHDSNKNRPSPKEAFLDWAKEHSIAIPSLCPRNNDNHDHSNDDDDEWLKSLASSIGDAKIVALSEGFHNCREMMLLHHRIIQYLVTHCGFNTVVTESGLPESRLIFDYIQGSDVGKNKEEMYKNGLNKMYGTWKEGRDLIEWMKSYNQENNNVLEYYGADIGGFYDNWKRPMEPIIQYLKQVDPDYATSFSSRWEAYLPIMSTNARINYSEQLSRSEQSQLALLLDEGVERFKTYEEKYVERNGGDEMEYQWMKQSLISMQLAENYYQNYLQMSGDSNSGKYIGLNGREIAMYRNILWAMQQRQKKRNFMKNKSSTNETTAIPTTDTKIILINHVVHTKTETLYQDKLWGYYTPLGHMLRQHFNKDYFAIGMVYGQGTFWNKWQKGETERFVAPVPPYRENGLESCMIELKEKQSLDQFFLPWKRALEDESVENVDAYWRFLHTVLYLRENDYFIKIKPAEWNTCIYLDVVGPATPAYMAP